MRTTNPRSRAMLRAAAMLLAAAACLGSACMAQEQAQPLSLPPNLPNPLLFANGSSVTTAAQWRQRRGQLLRTFTEQMYGRMPPRPAKMRFQVYDLDNHALGGTATREQVAILFDGRTAGRRMDLLVYIPNAVRHPPVILGLNFWGNETVDPDPGIRIDDRWIESGKNPFVDLSCVKDHRATSACRGIDSGRWPVRMILQAGYALATAYRGDIDPDHIGGYAQSIRSAYPQWTKGNDNFSTIAAWAWGLSRALDYLVSDPKVNGHRVIAFGWSRLGKAAVWAAATDPRFAALISNESGAGGAKLFHDPGGETILHLNTAFPYWFCRNFRQFNGRDASLPFDQNEVMALVAPRPLYIASAIDDRFSDPKGEFLDAVAVSSVYRFLGVEGLPTSKWPPVNQPVFGRVSYHVRGGGHSVTDFDWEQYLHFCDLYVKAKSLRLSSGAQPGAKSKRSEDAVDSNAQ